MLQKTVIPVFFEEVFNAEGAEFTEIGEFFIKNSLLHALRASAVQSPPCLHSKA